MSHLIPTKLCHQLLQRPRGACMRLLAFWCRPGKTIERIMRCRCNEQRHRPPRRTAHTLGGGVVGGGERGGGRGAVGIAFTNGGEGGGASSASQPSSTVVRLVAAARLATRCHSTPRHGSHQSHAQTVRSPVVPSSPHLARAHTPAPSAAAIDHLSYPTLPYPTHPPILEGPARYGAQHLTYQVCAIPPPPSTLIRPSHHAPT